MKKMKKIFLASLIIGLFLCLPYAFLSRGVRLSSIYLLTFLICNIITEGIMLLSNREEVSKKRIVKIVGCTIIALIISKIGLFNQIPYICPNKWGWLPSNSNPYSIFEINQIPDDCAIDYNGFLATNISGFILVKIFYTIIEIILNIVRKVIKVRRDKNERKN